MWVSRTAVCCSSLQTIHSKNVKDFVLDGIYKLYLNENSAPGNTDKDSLAETGHALGGILLVATVGLFFWFINILFTDSPSDKVHILESTIGVRS